MLDFVRYRQNLKGTKIGCREGDCGACTVLVGELVEDKVRYRSMTSCLMPLANAAGKHIVTVEGINPADGSLTPVQQAMVDESGTQCGFCTVGFVMSLTGFCVDGNDKTTGRWRSPLSTGTSADVPDINRSNVPRKRSVNSWRTAARSLFRNIFRRSLNACELNNSTAQAETRAVAECASFRQRRYRRLCSEAR